MGRAILFGGTLLFLLASCFATSPEDSATSTVPTSTSALPAPDPTSTTAPAPAIPVALEPSPGVERAAPNPDAPISELVAGLNRAGFDLWRTQATEDNLVFSPSSIGHALLMVRAAADQQTGGAIDRAFGLPEGLAAHEAWNALQHSIDESAQRAKPLGADEDDEGEHVVVVMADRAWPDVSASPSQEWIDLLVTHHGADVEVLDLMGDPAGSADAINEWIEEQTRGLIQDMATPGDVADNILMLGDTVYFKAAWLAAFVEEFTEPDTFTRLDGTEVEVPFMTHEERAPIIATEGDGWVAAELPYVGEEFSMLLIVPDEGRFSQVREDLGEDLISQIILELRHGNHQLVLPRWDHKASIDLQPWLLSLDIAPGSFPGIDPEAFLGTAKHAAKIIVDEQGTEAAAATLLGFPTSAGPPIDVVVRADRPFLYLIRHNPTGLVLFAGQVTDPSVTSS